MQESKTITSWSGYKIDGVVRIQENGKVLVLTRDQNDMSQSTIFDSASSPAKFGIYVKLPVVSAKGKKKWVPCDVIELYRAFFPDTPLPETLKRAPESTQTAKEPIHASQQIDLL